MRLTCLLIGQDNLLIQCGKFLLERNHQIKWVVTPVRSIQTWCAEQQIPWVTSIDELPAEREQSVDYLFSIVNGKILTSDDLKIARYASINYHDSLLPKYAGVNATTWSILNGETSHGITWHVINEGIDEGDIVYQGQFPISSNETALTLNLRCFEEAVKGFAELIHKIETSSLVGHKQQKEGRSYYGINQVLPDMGFINWKTADANSILRFYRALSFGNYSNNVGLLKIYLNDSYLIVLEAEIFEQSCSIQQGGVILSMGDEGLLVTTICQPILLKKLMTFDGKIVTAGQLSQFYGLSINQQLPFIEEDFLQSNTVLYKKALSHERYWLSQLTHIAEHSFFSDRMLDQNNPHKILPVVDFKKFSPSPTQNSTVYLVATVLVYLYRINNYENFTLFWLNSKSLKNASQSAHLFSYFLPFSANEFQSDFKLYQLLELINTKLELLNKHDIYLNDLVMRQPSLMGIADSAKEPLITIGLNNDNDELSKKSLIHFEIHPDTGLLIISHRINSNYQGGTSTPVIENMPTHISNILHVMLTEPNTLIHQFSFLSEEEQTKLFNWSVGEYLPLPSNTITDLFEQRVRFSPERAVVYENNTQLTYQQLWITAEAVTAFIKSLNLMPQSLIGISLAPSIRMLALILGIFKAGCIAVPIEPNTSGLMDEQKLSILFSLKPYSESLTKTVKEIYNVEELFARDSAIQNLVDSQPNLSIPRQNCLLLSTGLQGQSSELLNQKQLINYSYWLANNCQFDEQSVLYIDSRISFDQIITSVLSSLLVGGTLNFGSNHSQNM